MGIENSQKAENLNKIKQRLAEIDRELQLSPAYYYKQAGRIAPLLFCAAGMMTGIVIQSNLPLPVKVWLAAIVLCSMFAITSLAVPRLQFARATPVLVFVCFVCLGAIRLASFNRASPDDIRNSVVSEPNIAEPNLAEPNLAKPNLATLRGVIVTEPYIDSNEWRFSKFLPTDPRSSFYLEVSEAESVAGWVKASGLVRVRVQEPIFDLKCGDYVEMFCRLSRFEGATNPGEFDIAKYMARKGVYVAAAVESRDAIKVLQNGSAGRFSRFKMGLRKAAVEALLGGSYSKEEEDKLLLALVLGYRADIDRSTIEAFRETGLLHFICLSGMNFGILIGLIWLICRAAGLYKRSGAIVCIIVAVLFLLVVPENAPAFRAAIMCFAFCGAFIFRRRSNTYNSLALSAIVLLLISPTGLFEAGWQLSFASVLGILLFVKPINSFLREKASDWFSFTDEPGPVGRFVAKIASVTGSAFSVSLAAWLTSAGFLVYHFYSVSWLTSVWTVLVSPLIGVISFFGYLKLLVAFFLPSAAHVMGFIITFLSWVLIIIIKVIAGLHISSVHTGKVPLLAIILYYPLIAFVLLFPLRKPVIKKFICTIATAAIIVMLAMPRWQKAHGDDLVITALDVGHGQSLLAKLPDGSCMLFDAGSLSRNDVGSRVIIPFLQYSGIVNLNSVVLSHGDIDHINGLPEVVESTPTKAIYASNAFFEDKRQTTKFLRNELAQIIEINDLPQQFGSSRITVLWPVAGFENDDSISDNDKSIVTLLEYAGRRILICSDIQKFAQKQLLQLYPYLTADVVIAPHHGSVKTLEQGFISHIDPIVVISSCNITAYEKGQVIQPQELFKSYYTGHDGAVTIRITKQGKLETDTFIK
ncbi:MAG: DNA internalization-related competence protein ComEC/Rec2 [Sedimentisphaerales bacterium]